MTPEMWIIAAVRVLGALPVLRWAFAGAIIALLVDQSDLFMMNLIELGGVNDYQRFDKLLDQVYLLTFLAVAVRWKPAPRTVAVALYLFRLIGFVAFELTGNRAILLAFPNLFEFWVVFVAAVLRFRPQTTFSRRTILLSLPPLLLIKEFQEYVLHFGRLLDGFTAVQAVEWTWEWITEPFR